MAYYWFHKLIYTVPVSHDCYKIKIILKLYDLLGS